MRLWQGWCWFRVFLPSDKYPFPESTEIRKQWSSAPATNFLAVPFIDTRSAKEQPRNIVLPHLGAADVAKGDIVRAMTGLRHDVLEIGAR